MGPGSGATEAARAATAIISNNAQVIQAMERVAGMIAEDQLISGRDTMETSTSPRDRARDIMTNAKNPYYARYQRGDETVVEMVTGLLRGG